MKPIIIEKKRVAEQACDIAESLEGQLWDEKHTKK